jgi:hypothetical protein
MRDNPPGETLACPQARMDGNFVVSTSQSYHVAESSGTLDHCTYPRARARARARETLTMELGLAAWLWLLRRMSLIVEYDGAFPSSVLSHHALLSEEAHGFTAPLRACELEAMAMGSGLPGGGAC